ncbi:MAG: TonB-dependent hemoglobin/transferrin/lactoferrin family receptor [Pseudohongiella sp.]|nr:TonB-dependent hemoglobin/transferrin/lactoferrin family receptor [Pseudohongiella sp.]
MHTLHLSNTLLTHKNCFHLPVAALLMLCSSQVLSQAAATSGDAVPSAVAEEVIVTATRLPRRSSEIAGTVSVISDADIQRQMANDLSDLTRYQPGISMETANRGGNQGFVIRGIGGNRVLTVLDGVRSADIYNAGPSSYGKDAFELDDVKAVELIRGPASVLYGADAMGGAVLLRSKEAADYLQDSKRHHLGIRSSGDSANDQTKLGLTYATRAGTSVGDFDTVIQVTQREFSERDVNGDGSLNPQQGETVGTLLKTKWTLNTAHSFILTLDRRDEEVASQILTELSTSVQQSLADDSSTRKRVSLRHDWVLDSLLADHIQTQLDHQQSNGRQVSYQLRTSYAFVNPRNPASFRGTQAHRNSDFGFNQDTAQLSVVLQKALTIGSHQHAFVYGLHREETQTERPRERCDTEVSTGQISCAIPSYPMAIPEAFPNKTFPDTHTNRTGIFVQDEIRLLDQRLTLIPGVRVDRYQMNPRPDALFSLYSDVDSLGGFEIGPVDENNVSFNLGAVYQLTSTLNMIAQYAEGFRPANFDEANQAFVNAGHGYIIVPNTELQAETSQGLELGMRADLPNAALSLVAYDNRYDNFIESSSIGTRDGLSVFQDQNIGKARIYGAEATLDWFVAPSISLRNALAWSRGQDRITGAALDSVEPVTLVSAVRFAPDTRWAIEAVFSAAGKQKRVSAADRVQGQSWQTLDVLGHLNVGDNARVQLGIFNLTDEKYARWSSIRGLAASDTRTIANAQASGTHARLSLNLQF